MKHGYVYGLVVVLFNSLLLFSCNTLPVVYLSGRSWFMPEGKQSGAHTTWGTVRLLGISVDRSGGWDSVEKEVAALAPLYFWEQGYRLAGGGEAADFAADIQIREREYSRGWKTSRSLAVEVRMWSCEEGENVETDFTQRLPLAAGRLVSTGDMSFSSSKTTGRMVSGAIRKTVRRLSALRKKD
jgi:hypothetical protein